MKLQKSNERLLALIKSSLDIVVAVGLLQLAPKKVTPRVTGAFGFASSLIACYQVPVLHHRCLCSSSVLWKIVELELHISLSPLAAASKPTSEEQVRWPGVHGSGGGCIRRDWFGASPICWMASLSPGNKSPREGTLSSAACSVYL